MAYPIKHERTRPVDREHFLRRVPRACVWELVGYGLIRVMRALTSRTSYRPVPLRAVAPGRATRQVLRWKLDPDAVHCSPDFAFLLPIRLFTRAECR